MAHPEQPQQPMQPNPDSWGNQSLSYFRLVTTTIVWSDLAESPLFVEYEHMHGSSVRELNRLAPPNLNRAGAACSD